MTLESGPHSLQSHSRNVGNANLGPEPFLAIVQEPFKVLSVSSETP